MELKSVEDTSWLQLFIKQSPGPFLCDHITVAPLLPKLQG